MVLEDFDRMNAAFENGSFRNTDYPDKSISTLYLLLMRILKKWGIILISIHLSFAEYGNHPLVVSYPVF